MAVSGAPMCFPAFSHHYYVKSLCKATDYFSHMQHRLKAKIAKTKICRNRLSNQQPQDHRPDTLPIEQPGWALEDPKMDLWDICVITVDHTFMHSFIPVYKYSA